MTKQDQEPKLASGAIDHGRLTALINSMADGVLATDGFGKVVTYNGAALNILDQNGNISGKKIDKLLHLVDKNNQPIDVHELILKSNISYSTRDYKLAYNENDSINVYLSIAPVHLGYGVEGERGYVILLRDITHEKSLEEERDEFISVVSHELRTPITIAEGNISNAQLVAQKNNAPEAIIRTLKAAHDQIIYLSNMMNDLSTLSRAERGKLTVEVEQINVLELCQSLVSDYTPQAEKKGLKLLSDFDPSLELLKSSRLYVREILQNYITNGIKYTETGSVTLHAKPKEKGVEFRISDTGIGISKGDLAKIFDKFFRSEDFRTRSQNGTGLGLYVTMKLARLIHAEIDVKSELNKGSEFSIFIPNLE